MVQYWLAHHYTQDEKGLATTYCVAPQGWPNSKVERTLRQATDYKDSPVKIKGPVIVIRVDAIPEGQFTVDLTPKN